MNDRIENRSRKEVNGKPRIYYDGYWIRYYAPPAETLSAKKELLDMKKALLVVTVPQYGS